MEFGLLHVGAEFETIGGDTVEVIEEIPYHARGFDDAYAFRVRSQTHEDISGKPLTYNVTMDGRYWPDGRISEYDLDMKLKVINTPSSKPNGKIIFPKFTIGCDPEVVIRGKTGALNAAAFTEDFGYKEYACGNCGVDGNANILEFRPKEAQTPYQVVKNLQSLFVKACNNNPTLYKTAWMAGAYKAEYSIGGHIHFGVPLKPYMGRMLDCYLAAFAVRMEDTVESEKRKYKGYGRMNDIRHQEWGFEYRTLASWIYSPTVALATLSVAKHVVNQFRIKNNTIFEHNKLRKCLNDSKLDVAFNHLGPIALEEHFEEQWPELMSWPMEPSLKKGIDIFEILIRQGFKFDDRDIKKNWGIVHV
jgi:hypothetical protein